MSLIQRVPLIQVVHRGSLRPPPATRIGIEGRFHVTRLHRTRGVTGEWEFPNLILNSGLDSLGGARSLSNALTHLGVGTSNTTPAAGQTSLGAEVTRVNANGGFADAYSSGPDFAYSQLVRTRLFDFAQGNGNLTELGFFNASSAGTMFNRALFLDESDMPTTITKTSDDQLRIAYSIRFYHTGATPVDTTVSIGGDDYTCGHAPTSIPRWAQSVGMGSFGAWDYSSVIGHQAREDQTLIGLSNNSVLANTAGASSVSFATYTNGNYYRDVTAIWNPGAGDFATGVGSVYLLRQSSNAASMVMFGTRFTPKIPKTALDRFTYVYRVAWDRY
jgi:hypothetical protein